jgi:hypothetical protein
VNATGYKLLGFAVWKGARWYLARRLNLRRLAAKAAIALGALVALVVIVRRLAA